MKKLFLLLITSFLIVSFISCNGDKNNQSKGDKSNEKKEKYTEFNPNNIKIKIITFVPHNVLDAVVNSTKKSLIEKYNISKENIEIFNPNGHLDEVRTYVRKLNSHNTDLIISVSTPTSQAVLSARHPKIPLVFSFVSDTSALNLSKYRNVTGISNVLNYKKGFELLKKINPNLKKICVLYNPSEPNSFYSFSQINKIASIQVPPIKIISKQFTNPNEISVSASSVSDIDAYYVGGDNKLVKNIKLLLNVSKNKKIPVFASDEGSVKEGAIGAYSINYTKFGNETANLALKVLKNKSCKGINVIMYDKGECIINEKAMKYYDIDYSNLKDCSKINQ